MEDEVELRPGRVVVIELHPTPCVPVAAGPAGDRVNGVPGVGERTLDRDLAVRQYGREVALPGLPDHDPDAVALVASDIDLVGAVEDVVRKGQHVSVRVGRGSVADCVRVRMLDYMD